MTINIQRTIAIFLLLFSSSLLANNIKIENPYVRAIPPGQTISAAFMILNNKSDQPIDLISASSSIAKNVELHEHIKADGMMKMRQVPKISIPANAQTALKPGGYHIMLIDLTKTIKPTDIIELTLRFSNGSQQTIKAEVKKIMAGMMNMKKKHQKGKKTMMLMAKHANPMPNFMPIVNHNAKVLKLSDKQIAELKQWNDERMPISRKIIQTIHTLEDDLHSAAVADKPLNKIDQMADAIMQNRIKLIRGKALCRENMKRILDETQYKQVLALYSAKMQATH